MGDIIATMEVIDRWDEESSEGLEQYMTIEFVVVGGSKIEKVDIKQKQDGFSYIMYCGNGYEVYRDTDDGYRMTTEEEQGALIEFASEYLKADKGLRRR